MKFSVVWAKASIAVAAILLSVPLGATEPARQFLDALRERGYYDTAIDYVDFAETSPLLAEELKDVVPYERGRTLLEGAGAQRDLVLREKQLDSALESLQEFIKAKPTHPDAGAAKRELGNVLVQRAGIKVEKAGRPAFAAQRESLLAESKAHYAQAKVVFEDSKNGLRKLLESDAYKRLDPDHEQDVAKIEERERFRQEFLQTRLIIASVIEESANAVGADAPAAKNLLKQAALEYMEIHNDYRRLLAGLYARMYEGRCYLKMGDVQQALAAFDELLTQDGKEAAIRKLKIRTLALALEAWGKNPKTLDEGIKQGSSLLADIRPNESLDADVLECRYQLAMLLKQRASIDPNKNREDVAQARAVLMPATTSIHPRQRSAEILFVSLQDGGSKKNGELRTFADAMKQGQSSIEEFQAATAKVNETTAQLAATKVAEEKVSLKKDLSDAEKSVADAREQAFVAFQAALRFADQQTDEALLNNAQYFLCYLHYVRGDFHQSAIIGDFVAQRFGKSAGARSCALLALASYQKLYNQNLDSPDKGAWESQRVVATAEFITKQWPDQPEAIDAFGTLVPFLVKLQRLDEAVAAIKMIPETSPVRVKAELITGQALWASYLHGMHEMRAWEKNGVPAGKDLAAETLRLNNLKTRATGTLEKGIERLEKVESADANSSAAAFSLSQIYVDTSDYNKAVVMLSHPTFGPLTLVRRNDPSLAGRPSFAGETLQLAIRAHIGSLQGKSPAEAEKTIALAKGLMSELQKTVGAQEGGEAKIMAVYVGLAHNLNEQMKISTPDQRRALARGFQTFLAAAADKSKDYKILHWAAETFFALGESSAADKATAADARSFYEQSLKYLAAVLDLEAQKNIELDPKLHTWFVLRRAEALRRLGRFDAAVAIYEELLRANPSQITFQLEAARALMDQGDSGDEKGYERAIMGITPPMAKTKTVWGWYTMSQITGRKPEFAEYFHEARCSWAKALYGRSLLTKTPAEKKKMLASAQAAIEAIAKVYPDFGGDKWRAEYDALMKKIQSASGKSPVGIKQINLSEAQPGAAPASAK